jgi:leucyl aminopeptidase (aminopeptidase T)
MNPGWREIAERSVASLGVKRGELIEVSDHAGRYDVLIEFVLAIERRGATPRVELLPPDLTPRLLSNSPISVLSEWSRHRIEWMNQADRVLALEGHDPEFHVDHEAMEAWIEATERVTAVEEQRKLPFMLVAVPTEQRANSLELELGTLEAALLPALSVDTAELELEINRVRQALENANRLVVQTDGHRMELNIEGRDWMQDTGVIPDADGPRTVQPVVNLPAGSVYTSAQEWPTTGSLSLPRVKDAMNVVFHFSNGRVEDIQAESGAQTVIDMFDRHSGESRRISHLGIGLNPRLHHLLGWPLVDEHRHGALFIAFGENRYLGGENESSLNVDFVIPDAGLLADGRPIVVDGTCLV